MSSTPRVSVIMPVRNESPRIAECLDAVLASDYRGDRLEVLVVDGMSEDGTREAVAARASGDARLRLIDNPGRTAASGMNRGLEAARGEVIVRMDARTLPEPDYVRACVEVLDRSGASNVGGPQRTAGSGLVGRAAALATTSPFGVGDARFRYSEREEEVDTVYLGAWRRSTLEEAGGFDERLRVNQDYELNYRLRQAGGRILLSPRIRSTYRIRERLSELAGQYFRYGRGKAAMLRRSPGAVRWRQLAAPGLVAGLAASLALLPVVPVAAAIVPGTYLAATLLVSLITGIRRDPRALPALPAVFATIHLSWGLGFWAGVLRRIAG
jgi:cellulose synthase/poly-beta-1,6-N-acetylglucosamine synthase-like glycosyltransferase